VEGSSFDADARGISVNPGPSQMAPELGIMLAELSLFVMGGRVLYLLLLPANSISPVVAQVQRYD
jgi:hypothetical protein